MFDEKVYMIDKYTIDRRKEFIKLVSLFKKVVFCVIVFSTYSKVAASQTEISMVTMDQIPYGYKDSEGKEVGVLFDIMNAIMHVSGIGEKNTLIPSKRLGVMLLSGSSVCVIVANTPDVTTPSLIAPIGYSLKMGILPKIDSGITDYKSLTGKTVAVPLGVQFDTLFHNDTSIIKVSPPQYINAIKMLKAGRVDAVAGALINLQSIAKSVGMQEKDLAPPIILSQNQMYIICSKEVLTPIRQKLKKAVEQLRETGEIQTILRRYLEEK
jgi:polar amino acid transport system substrate-binding protein